MNILIAIYFAIGFIFALVFLGYNRRDWGRNSKAIAVAAVMRLVVWPVVIAVAFGEVMRDRADRTEKMQREFDEGKARVKESLEKKR